MCAHRAQNRRGRAHMRGFGQGRGTTRTTPIAGFREA
jgi:hypothetical protein